MVFNTRRSRNRIEINGTLEEDTRMVIKVTMRDGSIKYYAGRDKKGKIILSDYDEAKKYKPGAKGSLNQVLYALEKQGMTAEYVEEQVK